MPKVSVIIPVYNVEQYIERCARSLFEQTLDDIEYIFVNDCTPDKSMEVLARVLEDYPSRKDQVRIIDMPVNSGQAKVRKVGIEAATGDYIIHCDSDDWVDVTIYEKMWKKAVTEDLEMVICNKLFKEFANNQAILSTPPGIYSKPEYFRAMLSEYVFHYLWSSLMKRELFLNNAIVYPECNSAEDFVLMVQLMYFSEKIAFIEEPMYHYRYNLSSITGAMSKEKILNRCNQVKKNIDLIIDFLKSKHLEDSYRKEILLLKYSVRMQIKSLLRDDDAYEKWRSIYPELDSQFLRNKEIPLKKKISYLLSYFRVEPYYRRLYSRFHK